MRSTIENPDLRNTAERIITGMCRHLSTLREEADLTQSYIGKTMGVSTGALWWWERTGRVPAMRFFLRWARFWELRVVILDADGVRINPPDTIPVGVLSWEWHEFRRMSATMRAVRTAQGVGVRELADQMSVSTSLLTYFESSSQFISPRALCTVVAALGCDATLEPLDET